MLHEVQVWKACSQTKLHLPPQGHEFMTLCVTDYVYVNLCNAIGVGVILEDVTYPMYKNIASMAKSCSSIAMRSSLSMAWTTKQYLMNVATSHKSVKMT